LPPKPKTPYSALWSLAKIAARQREAVLGFSDTYISRDLTRLDSRAESRVIPFGLIAISFGEIGDHTIETLASTQIRRDLYTIAGAGVRSGQRPAAYALICPHMPA
jgi:hypothetical protein